MSPVLPLSTVHAPPCSSIIPISQSTVLSWEWRLQGQATHTFQGAGRWLGGWLVQSLIDHWLVQAITALFLGFSIRTFPLSHCANSSQTPCFLHVSHLGCTLSNLCYAFSSVLLPSERPTVLTCKATDSRRHSRCYSGAGQQARQERPCEGTGGS